MIFFLGGGHFHWKLYFIRVEKNMDKGYVFQGWARNAGNMKGV